MKRFSLLFLLLLVISVSFAQVETNYFLNRDAGNDLRISKSNNQNVIRMPSFDLVAMQKEDAERDGKPGLFRFGKGFDVTFTLADGQWEDTEGGRLWTMTFESKNALSLNFVFNDFHLPEGAELYIINKDETVLFGPVTADATTKNGIFLTDIIEGSQATISLFEPTESIGQSTLIVKRVIHGYRRIENYRRNTENLTDSKGGVRSYSDPEDEADAIGYVVYPTGDFTCSGALVMSNDFSFRPFFLTTFLLPDGNIDGVLSGSEIAETENSMFKFPCKISGTATSYTYNQADFRSAWNTTYFSLFELRDNLKQNPNLSWLSWNSSSSTPSSGVFLFPSYSSINVYYSDAPIANNTYSWDVSFGYSVFSGTYGSNTHLYGAPVLDQNMKLIGFFNEPLTYWKGRFGKFNASLSGGLTNSTSLALWLDPESNAFTKSSYRSFIIAGPSTIISSSTYSVLNLPSDMSVIWTLSDSYYNQNCLQQNSPSNNQCTITKSSSHSMSSATLTATIKRGTTTITTIQKTVSTGSGFDGTYFNGLTTKQIDLPTPLYVVSGTTVTINSSQLIGATVSQNGGNGSPTSWNFNSTAGTLQVGMPSSVGITIVVKVITSGSVTYNLPIITTANDYGQLYVTQNGPSFDISVIPLNTDFAFDTSAFNKIKWKVTVYNAITGENVYNKCITGFSDQVEADGWKPGVYIINAVIGKENFNRKVVVK